MLLYDNDKNGLYGNSNNPCFLLSLSLSLFIVASVILLHLLIYMYCLSVYHDKTAFMHNRMTICFSCFQTKMNGMGKMYSFYEKYWITHNKDYTSINYDTVLPFNVVIKSILCKKKKIKCEKYSRLTIEYNAV